LRMRRRVVRGGCSGERGLGGGGGGEKRWMGICASGLSMNRTGMVGEWKHWNIFCGMHIGSNRILIV